MINATPPSGVIAPRIEICVTLNTYRRLYVLSVTQISILGAITPLGGVAFIISWIMIIVAAVKYL